jgi:S-formylglutathione hydrolase FrmB
MALAMPSDGLWGDGSGYLRHGDADYERWIVEEIPAIARKVLRSVGNHSSIYLSGLSMGGYGALRLGALHSAKFRGVSAHSSITEIHQLGEFVEEPVSPLLLTAGCTSVLEAIKAHSRNLPPIRFDCGASDPLIEPNRALHQALDDASIEHVYQEFPGGHQWAYWEEHLSDTLRFFAEIERQR